ncbi:MAG: hypothetical protein ACI4B6_07490 [Atopobiaceae bacterium]
MSNARVERMIPSARDAIIKAGISEGGSVKKAFRGQISTFGAAITMGSLLPAVAFFSDQGSAEVDRTKLMKAIMLVLQKEEGLLGDFAKRYDKLLDLCTEVCNVPYAEGVCANELSAPQLREGVIDAAIAIKLAMNYFRLVTTDGGEGASRS